MHYRIESLSNSLFMCFDSVLDDPTIVLGAVDGLFRGGTSSPEAVDKCFSFVANTRVAMTESIFGDDVEVFSIPRLKDETME